MSAEECQDFQRELAIHTAPAMLGAKPSNLVMIEGRQNALRENIREFNRKAASRGLRIRELGRCRGRTLMLLYNERLLNEHLNSAEVRTMFRGFGYGRCRRTGDYLELLSERIGSDGGFPHEIGLFLGYPVEDVRGFIINNGRNSLLTGYWKVYSDTDRARSIFERYNKCRKYLENRLKNGDDLYKALRISQGGFCTK